MSDAPIRVTVLLFASLREAAGVEQVALELPGGSVVSDAWPELVRRFPALNGKGSSLAWAVNHAYARPDQPLQDGDQVAALPPISGGADCAGGGAVG